MEANLAEEPTMFDQLQNWIWNRKQQRPHRPRPLLTPKLEPLEERWCPAGDTYEWNPPTDPANYDASNPANWMKDGVQQDQNGTLPGQNGNSPNDTVILDGNQNNLNIVWDQSFTFSTLEILRGYIGAQTINKDVTLHLTGVNAVNNNFSLSASGNELQVNFADITG
jgi:hypothetical protein